MRYQEGGTDRGARADERTRRPGSRISRLSDANKQLSILLDDVDLDDEPALGEALTEAVRAVGQANELVDGVDERRRSEAVERSSKDRQEWRDDGDRPAVREPNDLGRSTIESGRFAFVPEAGVE